ncbi:MAG: hypothetical protein JNN28_14565 [Saprospiraceae bacterium]|nr:hypothetical protein [Saprospiraceae bacterium]
MKKFKALEIPDNLIEILEEEGYWEDDTFDPVVITIEEIFYKEEAMMSYQAAFDVLDTYEEIDGDEWEELIKNFIEEKEPGLEQRIKGDSESSTCVLWTNNEADFRLMLKCILALLEDDNEINRIIKKKASS